MRWVFEGATCPIALFVKKKVALPAYVDSGSARGVAARARDFGATGQLVEVKAVVVAEMLVLSLHLSLSLCVYVCVCLLSLTFSCLRTHFVVSVAL